MRQFLPALILCVLTACGGDAPPARGSADTYDSQGRIHGIPPRLDRPPNLIVVIIDSLRADALGDRMPALQKRADEGVVFTEASAPASWTLPSMVSMFTGLLPSAHGQYQPLGGWHLPNAVTTYPEILAAGYGYETAAFVMGPWFKHRTSNLLQGFGAFGSQFSLQDLEVTVGRWNARRDPDKPFFLLLHTYDAHEPYGASNRPWPPRIKVAEDVDPALLAADADPAALVRAQYLDAGLGLALSRRIGPRYTDTLQRYKYAGFAANPDQELADDLRTAYWDGVRWVDGLLERSIGELEAWGLLENTLLVITADHGEAFGEHGNLGHGLTLYDDLLRVPLVMTGPPPFDKARTIDESIGLIDVLPTFLDWAGVLPLEGVSGRSAMKLVKGESWCRPVVAEERLTRSNTASDVDAAIVSVRTNRWKYIANFDMQKGAVREEAYDLGRDPDEQQDLGEGKGILPEGMPFDDCICPAVEAMRDRLWDVPGDAADDPYSIPYGAAAARVRSPRPSPCKPAR